MVQELKTLRPEVVDHTMAAVLREKSPAERLAIAHGLWRSAARMVRGILRNEHPGWSDEKIGREAARRLSHGAG
jgi:Rv0078B-related antitoxin